jgi:hypothetical protein
MREIEISKFTEYYHGLIVVCFRRFFFGGEASKIGSLVLEVDLGVPKLFAFNLANTLQPGFGPRSTIGLIQSSGTLPKVFAAIVKRIVVFVVTMFLADTAENNSVHQDASLILASPLRSKTLGAWTPFGTPIPCHQPIKVLGINDGISAVSQRDITVRCIERLNNKMTFDRLFGHVPTSIGICFRPPF